MPAVRETPVAAERRPWELLPAARVRRGPARAQRPDGALVAVLPWQLFKGRAEGWGFINLCFRQNSWRCGSVRCPVNATLEFLSRCVQRGKGGCFAQATAASRSSQSSALNPPGFCRSLANSAHNSPSPSSPPQPLYRVNSSLQARNRMYIQRTRLRAACQAPGRWGTDRYCEHLRCCIFSPLFRKPVRGAG